MISREMDAAFRALVAARQLKSRWKELVDVCFQLLCGCTQPLSSHKQSYEHAFARHLTPGTVLRDLGKPLYYHEAATIEHPRLQSRLLTAAFRSESLELSA